MSQWNCTMCGPTGPVLETHVVVALLRGDEVHANELLGSSNHDEVGDLLDLTQSLERVAERRAEALGPRWLGPT